MDPSVSEMVTQGANRVGERGQARSVAAVGSPAPIVLGPDALTTGCEDVKGTLVCGGKGRPL